MTIQNGVLKTSGVLQLKGGSAQNLTAANPLLARREIAVEIDTGKIKVGNGEDYWNDLPYTGSGGGGGTGGGTMIPSLVFSKTSIDLRLSSRKNTTFTVYTTSNGTISVRSTNPSVANASVNGNTVTVTAVSTGNANIIVDIASDGSYYGISDFISVEVLMGFRYGYRIKKNEPDPYERVEYLFDAVGLTPAHMDFDNGVFDYGDWRDKWFVTLNKPCMLKFDGTVDYYLNPNNYDEKEDGTASDVSNTSYEGNAMAQIPLCWVKRYEEDGYEYEIVSDVQFDDDYKAYAHTRSDGSIADFFYWSMFGASGDENKLRSLSGQSLAQNLTTENQIAGATANGDNWYIHSWCQRELIRTLLVLIGKSTDTQAVFGLGNCRTAGNSSGLLNTGTLNDKGQFFGFHSTSQQVKVFHIEKFWGDQWERTAGLINNKGTIFVKMTPEGEGYRVHDVNGYENTGITLNDSPSGYIRAGYISAFGFLPNNSNGSSSTYYCDYGYFEYSQLYYLFTGAGASTDSVRGGAFSFDVDGTPDTALWYIGCGLSCVPPATA